jgi:cellulose synthase/poly-beta-1,6-N-acetylglucosamine synthase-like glycosyltransferase
MLGATLVWAAFLGAAAAITYILVIYPLVLAWMAARRGRPIKKKASLVAPVTVIVPVRNGERWVRRKIESILSLDYPRELLEILFVSDGSTDATEPVIQSYSDKGIQLLTVPRGGKPAALNAAVPQARGEFLFLTDVRQSLDPACLRQLVSCMADPEVGVVSGNLLISKGKNREQASTSLYWRYENWIRGNLSRLDSMLGATGPVYLIRRSLYVPIPADSLLDDVFLPMSVHVKGYRLVQEERAIAVDEPTDIGSEFRRKVRTQAGILQFIASFPAWHRPANRMRLAFLSLKLGRLCLPYFLAILLLSAFLLPYPWNVAAATPQVAFWLLAASDSLMPEHSFAKKLTAPAAAFASLAIAALLAWKILFVPPNRIWVEARAQK